MAQHKVRWALISYSGDTEPTKLAFRGMTVNDIPADEAEQLLANGAIVAADAELDMPGTLLPLPVAPSDEELVAWVGSASQTEVLQAVSDRPELSARIKDAWAAHQERMRAQLEVLGQRIDEIPDAPEEPEQPATEVEPGTEPEPVELNDEYFDQVVAQNSDDVSKFVSEYPQYAQQVLAAENRRGDKPRVGVVRAVEAAAAFNAQ